MGTKQSPAYTKLKAEIRDLEILSKILRYHHKLSSGWLTKRDHDYLYEMDRRLFRATTKDDFITYLRTIRNLCKRGVDPDLEKECTILLQRLTQKKNLAE